MRGQQLGVGERAERRRPQGVQRRRSATHQRHRDVLLGGGGSRRVLEPKVEPGLRGRVPRQCHPQPAEPGACLEAARDPHRRREQHQGRGAVPAGALSLRSVSHVGAYSVLLRSRYDPGGAGRVPQGERPSARFDREAHRRRLELRHRPAPGDAAERRPGTGDVVGRQGLQGPCAGVRRRPEPRPLGLGVSDVARGSSIQCVQPGNALRSRLAPRLDWTVGRDSVPYKDWGLHNRGWIRDASYSGPFSPKRNVHEKGANAENNVGWQATQTNDVNIHIFRYADMLLLLAEAEIHATTGILDNARTIVNQIRARAGKVAQGCGTITDTILTKAWPTCKTDAAIQNRIRYR